MTEDESREDEPLNIELDDLDDEPEEEQMPSVAGADTSGDRLVIDMEDLDVDPGPAAAPPSSGRSYPAVGGGSSADLQAKAKTKKGAVEAIFGNLMLQMFIAGLIGGFLAWLINEPWTHDEPTSRDQITSIYIQSVIFFGIVGALVGAALGSVESLLTGAYMKMLRDGAIGLGLGALGGAAAGFIGQFAYASIGGGRSGIAIQIISRTIGWALAGMAIGLAQGARYMNFNRLLNGFIGGAVGGFVGGLLFDVIATVVGGAEISRLIALVVIGGATGAAIGLLEEVRKEAWLSIVDGPLTGKEFILYQQQTTIGSAGYCDIPLLKDPNVAPEHARIVMQGNAIRLENLLDPEAVLVNDQPVSQHALSNGDFIHIGSTVFQYNDRAVDAPHP